MAPRPTPQDGTPATVRADVLLQLAQLREPGNAIPGVYVLPDEGNLLIWHGCVFVRRGAYVGGVFRFDVHFPRAFLSSTRTPDVIFPPTLLHPLVDATTFRLTLAPRFSAAGQAGKEAWAPQHGCADLLRYIRDVFSAEALDAVTERQAVNKEVYAMYRNNHDLFLKLASQSKHLSTSSSALYDVNSGSGLPGPRRAALDASTNGSSAHGDGDGDDADAAAVGDTSTDSARTGGTDTASDDRSLGIPFRRLRDDEFKRIRARVTGVAGA